MYVSPVVELTRWRYHPQALFKSCELHDPRGIIAWLIDRGYREVQEPNKMMKLPGAYVPSCKGDIWKCWYDLAAKWHSLYTFRLPYVPNSSLYRWHETKPARNPYAVKGCFLFYIFPCSRGRVPENVKFDILFVTWDQIMYVDIRCLITWSVFVYH